MNIIKNIIALLNILIRNNSPHFPGILIICSIIFLAGIFFVIFSNSLEFFTLDLKFYLISHLNQKSVSNIISVILIDKNFEKEYGIENYSQWREIHTDLIKILINSGAALIVFDAEFNDGVKEVNPSLEHTFQQAGNIITGEFSENSTTDTLKESIYAIGDLSMIYANDIPRRIPLFSSNTKHQALSLVTAKAFLKNLNPLKASDFIKESQLNKLIKSRSFCINYNKPVYYFDPIAYKDVLNSISVPAFKGKIILIGYYMDNHPYPNMGYKQFSGVFAHAYGIENILHNNFLIKVPNYVNIIILFSFCIIQQIIYELIGKRIRLLFIICLSILLLTGVFFIEYLLQNNFHIWIHFSSLLVTAFLYILFNTIYKKIIITKKVRQISNYEQIITEHDYQKSAYSELIIEQANRISSCINSIKSEFHVKSRLQKYFSLTLQTCEDIMYTSSIINKTVAIKPEKIHSEEIKNEFCTFFKHHSLTLKNIDMDINDITHDFYIYSDKTLFQKLLKTVFENILIAIDKNSTLFIYFDTTGENRTISFFYRGNNVSKNNPYFSNEILKKNKGKISFDNEKMKKSIKLSFLYEV
ncbi:MAG: CHASE2 domain-containing protein [Spirochaetales bacterium]|nr:CHASE2 domain-containing protein [Spirochaetales bacterium]